MRAQGREPGHARRGAARVARGQNRTRAASEATPMSAAVPPTTAGQEERREQGRRLVARSVERRGSGRASRTTRSAARSDAASAALRKGPRSMSGVPRSTRARDYIGYDPVAMPANRDARSCAREPLDGAYVILTFRHPEVARDGPGRPVRDDQGRHLRRAAAAAALLHPQPSIPRRETFSLFLKAIGPGHAAPWPRSRRATSPSASARSAGPSPARRRRRRPSSSRAATASRPSCSSARSCRRSAAARPRLLRRPHRRATCRCASRFAALGVPLVAATEDGSLGRARAGHGAPRGLPRRAARDRCALYACGPDAMLHAVARLADARGLRRRGQPRSLDGLRRRHLPRLRRLHPGARTSRGRSTAAPAPRARCSTPPGWSGRARDARGARRGASQGRWP